MWEDIDMYYITVITETYITKYSQPVLQKIHYIHKITRLSYRMSGSTLRLEMLPAMRRSGILLFGVDEAHHPRHGDHDAKHVKHTKVNIKVGCGEHNNYHTSKDIEDGMGHDGGAVQRQEGQQVIGRVCAAVHSTQAEHTPWGKVSHGCP